MGILQLLVVWLGDVQRIQVKDNLFVLEYQELVNSVLHSNLSWFSSLLIINRNYQSSQSLEYNFIYFLFLFIIPIKPHQFFTMNQTFEQKRIVELSKKLDQERQRCETLVKETHDQAKQIEFLKECYQNEQALKQQMELVERQLRAEISSLCRQVSSLKEQKTIFQKKLIQAQYATMRTKQLIQQQQQDHKVQIQKMKEQIFGLEQVIAQKEKQNMKLRQQNLQLQKMYLNKRSQMQTSQQKHFKQLSKLTLDFQALKSEILQLGKLWQSNLDKEKHKLIQIHEQFDSKIKEIQAKIQEVATLRKTVNELEQRLEQVVVENSQRIIELYNVKYSLR